LTAGYKKNSKKNGNKCHHLSHVPAFPLTFRTSTEGFFASTLEKFSTDRTVFELKRQSLLAGTLQRFGLENKRESI
jgi:hypothetical protein